MSRKLPVILFMLTFFSGMVFAVYQGRADITAYIRFISPLPAPVNCRQLPAPENLFIFGDILVWDYVDNATRFDLYTLELNEVVGSTEEVYFDLGLLNLSADIHHFQVRAIGDGIYYIDSYLSDAITHIVFLNFVLVPEPVLELKPECECECECECEYEYECECEYEYEDEPEYEYEYEDEPEYEYEYEDEPEYEYEYEYEPEYEYEYEDEPEYEYEYEDEPEYEYEYEYEPEYEYEYEDEPEYEYEYEDEYEDEPEYEYEYEDEP